MKQFIVGPVEMYPRTKHVLDKGYIYFRTTEYGNMAKNCLNKISEYIGNKTENATIYLAASGTGAMEAIIDNCMTKKDKALVINGGVFGHRFCEILKWHNIKYDAIDLLWNEVINEKHLSFYEHKGYSTLFVNLNETSYGKLYDINLISNFCKRNNMMLIVDAISTFLADEYNMNKYGIDATIISSQKGLCLSAGMSIVSFSTRMLNKILSNSAPTSYYFNFKEYFKNIKRGQTPYTPPVTIMYELNDMINMIENNGGIVTWINNVAQKCNYFRKKAQQFGFIIPSYPKSNMLTPLYFEEGKANEMVEELKNKYQLYINPCSGEMAEKLLRVAHIGNTTIEDIDDLLDKMYYTFKKLKKES